MPDVSPRRAGRAKAKSMAAGMLCAAGVPALARWQNAGRLTILMYHGVEGEPLSPPCDYVIDAGTMRRQFEYLRRHFNVLPLPEALDRLRDGTLPRRAATLTFDDGTRNLAIHAAPVLRDLNLPAAVFVSTGPMGTAEALWPDRLWIAFAGTQASEIDLTAVGLGVRSLREPAERDEVRNLVVQHFKGLPDEERLARVQWLVGELGTDPGAAGGPFEMLSWDEARELAGDGRVSIYPHTVTHPILSRCSDEKVDYEISESCRVVAREMGSAPTVFAYPNGTLQDFDDRARDALRRNGIDWALSTTSGFADHTSDPLALPRIGIGPGSSLALFRLKVSGFNLRWVRTLASRLAPQRSTSRDVVGVLN